MQTNNKENVKILQTTAQKLSDTLSKGNNTELSKLTGNWSVCNNYKFVECSFFSELVKSVQTDVLTLKEHFFSWQDSNNHSIHSLESLLQEVREKLMVNKISPLIIWINTTVFNRMLTLSPAENLQDLELDPNLLNQRVRLLTLKMSPLKFPNHPLGSCQATSTLGTAPQDQAQPKDLNGLTPNTQWTDPKLHPFESLQSPDQDHQPKALLDG